MSKRPKKEARLQKNDLREYSRKAWWLEHEKKDSFYYPLNQEDQYIQLGCLLRIADALESIANSLKVKAKK